MRKIKNNNIYVCKTCGSETSRVGHLCDPKKVSRNTKLHICKDCGLIATKENLLCKPGLLKLK